MALASAQTVGRETELEQVDTALDALGEGARRACVAWRASRASARRGCSPSCARAPRAAATWCWRAPRPSSSATCRSASGWTRSTRTSPRATPRQRRLGPRAAGRAGRVLPSLRRTAGADSAVADERYRAHRAIRERCWSVLAEDQAAGARAGRPPLGRPRLDRAGRRAAPARAGRAGAARFRVPPGQAPERLSAALAVPAVTRIELGQLSEARGGRAARRTRRRRDRRDLPPRRREPVLPRAARARERRRPAHGASAGNGAGTEEGGVPAAVAAALAEELESLSPSAPRPPERRGRGGRALRARPGRGGRRAARRRRGSRRSTSCWRRPRSPDPGPARVHLPPPAGAARRLRVDARRAGGWRRTLARPRRSRRAAPRRPSGRTTSSSRPARATRTRSQLLLEAGDGDRLARAAAAAVRWFEAALRLLPAADRERQVDVRVALASALRSLGELESCRETLLEAIELVPPDAVERRRGADRPLRRRRALARPPRRGASPPVRRVGGAARARRSAEAAALQIELAVDGLYTLDFEQTCEMGARRARDRARARRHRADRRGRRPRWRSARRRAGQIDAAREHREEARRA